MKTRTSLVRLILESVRGTNFCLLFFSCLSFLGIALKLQNQFREIELLCFFLSILMLHFPYLRECEQKIWHSGTMIGLRSRVLHNVVDSIPSEYISTE